MDTHLDPAERAEYDAWMATSDVTTPHSPSTVLSWKLGNELKMRGGDVLRIIAGQPSQLNKSPAEAERVHRLLTHVIMDHPELTIGRPTNKTLRLVLRSSEGAPAGADPVPADPAAAAEEPSPEKKGGVRHNALTGVANLSRRVYGTVRQRISSKPA